MVLFRYTSSAQSHQSMHCSPKHTIMTVSYRTDRSGQTVQTQIRLLCLLFHLHHFDKIPLGLASLYEY